MDGGIDIIQILTGVSPPMAIAAICLYWMRSVYNDALRREIEYAESLKELYAQLFAAQQVWSDRLATMAAELHATRNDAMNAIREELHALKGTIQNFVLERADRRNTDSGTRPRHD